MLIEDLLKGIIVQAWDVFISYSTKDRPVIEQISKDLQDQHITVWVDFEQIEPGDVLVRNIENALSKCRFGLICYSRNQLKSVWCNAEYEVLLTKMMNKVDTDTKLMPLIIDDLKIDELPMFAKRLRCVRYSDKEEYGKLLKVLKK